MRPLLILSLLCGLAFGLGACAGERHPAEAPLPPARIVTDGVFTMDDGARLPYRAWLPDGPPRMVVLALHGVDDSRDAWITPAPLFAAQGIALFAPDERGFGATEARGTWPGTARMLADARRMALDLRARYPDLPLYLMGESMGGAVLLALAGSPLAPPVSGYVFSAPAVWGRAQMNFLYRAALWLADRTVPNKLLGGGGLGVVPTNNEAAWRALSEDPLTLTKTRVFAVKGLVDLMDAALAAAGRLHQPALFLYGGHDELVPAHAMAAAWAAAEQHDPAARFAFYPGGYHLLERDHGGAAVTADIIHWMQDHAAPLPSGAEARAEAWLAHHAPG